MLTCLVWSTLSFSLIFSAHPSSSALPLSYTLDYTFNIFSSCISTLLSLPSHCSQEDVKSLTAHIVENYWKALEDVDYVQTFKGLKLRYEQQRERQDNPKLDRWENRSCTTTSNVTGDVMSEVIFCVWVCCAWFTVGVKCPCHKASSDKFTSFWRVPVYLVCWNLFSVRLTDLPRLLHVPSQCGKCANRTNCTQQLWMEFSSWGAKCSFRGGLF